MAKPKSYIEIAFESIKVFTDDGRLDLGELNFLLGLALRDDHVDDDERRVLGRVFAQAEKGQMADVVRERIDEARQKYGIPAA
jgi:hypothetical protein